jgi:uncharacterized membrane protein YwaF
MRTLILIVVGLLLLAIALKVAKPEKRRAVAWVFGGVWLLATLANLALGLSHGYTLQQELPIHLVLFGVPAVAAWWFSKRAP